MSKSSYTKEELKLLAGALEREKKKASQVDELKLLLMTLKLKYDRAVAELDKPRSEDTAEADLKEENQLFSQQISNLKQALANMQQELEADRNAKNESQKHAEQLERVIHFLRERSEEGQLELKQLRADYQQLQHEGEKRQTPTAQPPPEELRIDVYEQELARIKQTLIRALRESQELQAHHQAVVEEKISFISKYRQTQSQLEKVQEQNRALQHKLDAIFSQENQLHQQHAAEKLQAASSLSAEMAKQEQQATLIRQREESILDLQRQVGLLRHEGEKTRDELELVHNSISEYQAQLQEAEEHLARKVKESAELEMGNQAQKQQIDEMHQILQAGKVRIAELSASCEMYEQQQKRMQEQLQEAIKAYEGQQTKWEEKYLALYDKWQTAEGRIKELEKLEERYKHLQGLFSNVGNFLSVPNAPHISHEPPVEKAPVEKEEQKEKTPKVEEKPRSNANLFDSQRQAARHKQNLLD